MGKQALAGPTPSYYLPAALAGHAEALRAEARLAAAGKLGQLPREAAELYPGSTDQADQARAQYITSQVEQLGLYYSRQIPRGTVARMAIDRWAGRSPDEVTAAAVDWCQAVHVQWHRARRDMVRLRR